MKTLPDWIAPGLDLVSIGINPSLYSVERGFPFARPQNRFWPALARSRLVGEELKPSVDAVERLLRVHKLGFTDVVKRATNNASQLRASDWTRGVKELEAKLRRFRPRIAWFQGRMGWQNFCARAGIELEETRWGLQPVELEGAQVFVTPNPSAANASYSLAELVRAFDELAELVRERRRGSAR